MSAPPEVVELWPWETAGGVSDFRLAGNYLGLLRKRFSPVLARRDWKVVLSPYLLSAQSQVWNALLRESSMRKFELISNLDCLSWGRVDKGLGLFLHWGSSGADLGACLQGETYRYQRLLVGEDFLVRQLQDFLTAETGQPAASDEAYRLLRIVTADGLTFPGGRLVEIGWGGETSPWRASLEQEVLLQAILNFLQPQFEAIESFVRTLSPQDHRDLFEQGLWLSGAGVTLQLLRDCLQESFEFPVRLLPKPADAVLASPRLC